MAASSSTRRPDSSRQLHPTSIADDGGEFVGILYDTILYERACYRLHTLHKYDFPLKYDELAFDFLTAYRFCLEPKFLTNKNTAVFSQYILKSKLLTAKGVRAYALEHLGKYEIFPSDSYGEGLEDDFMSDEVEELDEEDFSDFDEVEHGFNATKKKVGYVGPILTKRRMVGYNRQGANNNSNTVGQAHREAFASDFFAVYKHSQDMIAAIIAVLRKRVWYHDGSGGEVVEIRSMGADSTPTSSSSSNLDHEEIDPLLAPVKGVKGVKKYTRRFNGKIKRRNYERNQASRANGVVFGFVTNQDPPTDYSDSESETVDAKNGEMQRIEEAIAKLASTSLADYTGSAKRKIHWVAPGKSEALYDWNGVNSELRLIDLPSEEADPAFYGCLTRDIMNKYKKLLPPPELMERHKQLTDTLQKVISAAFPGDDLKVEPYGSFVSGLLMGNSDADFCITGPNIHDHEQLNDMVQLGNILESQGQMHNVICIPDAMVPIVKFLDPVTNMECDLNTGNNLGVINSELIRTYTTIDERVKPFLYMIKAICKAQGINDARSGYLSSYAITWMGIVFLQQEENQTKPAESTGWEWDTHPVLPRLQQQPFERMTELTLRLNHNVKNTPVSTTSLVNSAKSDMVHCRFDRNEDGKHTGSGRANPKSLARLLIEFFEFFSRRFFYAEMAIHVGRAQFVPKTSKEMHNESTRLATFRVVDPFLHHRNITGTCRGETLGRVWRAFDHSYRMLSSGDLEGAMVTID
ncbi:hypothetical protein BGZ75_001929 [Mortierella antarctica]|nr:hypothetical protein BGZ75_001929 [Mortierella antarctica]